MELKYIGGVYGGNIKPAPYLCLLLKMLQIQPEKDIVVEFIKNEDFKYVRALGAMYMRLVGTSLDCFKYLEPLYLDYRKLKRMNKMGELEAVHMDEFIDELLHEERFADIILPRIQKRHVLEETNQLEPRTSALDDDLEEMETDEEEEVDHMKDMGISAPPPDKQTGYRDYDKPRRSPSPRYRKSRSRSRSPHRRRGGSRERDRDRERERPRSRSRERHRDSHRDRDRRKSRSRSREHHRSSGRKHRHDDEDRPRKHHKSKKSRREHRDHDERNMSREDLEIKQANDLRARLGMQPLRY